MDGPDRPGAEVVARAQPRRHGLYVASMNGKLYAVAPPGSPASSKRRVQLDLHLRPSTPGRNAAGHDCTRYARPAGADGIGSGASPTIGPTARSTSAPTTATSTRSRRTASCAGCSKPSARSPASGRPRRSARTASTLYFGANRAASTPSMPRTARCSGSTPSSAPCTARPPWTPGHALHGQHGRPRHRARRLRSGD